MDIKQERTAFEDPRVTGAPDSIWLCYGDLEHDDTHAECRRQGEVTWCEDKQGPADVQYVRAALAEAPVQAVPQWRDIETAPKDGTTVLTFRLLNGEPQIADARYFPLHGNWGQRSWRYAEHDGPTHWMPLPEAPGAPQPAGPLTDLQIASAIDARLSRNMQNDIEEPFSLMVARAIEAAHGIRAAGVKEPGNAQAERPSGATGDTR